MIVCTSCSKKMIEISSSSTALLKQLESTNMMETSLIQSGSLFNSNPCQNKSVEGININTPKDLLASQTTTLKDLWFKDITKLTDEVSNIKNQVNSVSQRCDTFEQRLQDLEQRKNPQGDSTSSSSHTNSIYG